MQYRLDRAGNVWALSLALACAACGTNSPPPSGDLDYRDSDGPPRGGGWYINNGLFHPEVGMFDVTESLAGGDGVDETAVTTDNDIASTRYAIECALPDGQSITETINGAPMEFPGALGLAPEWYDGSCDSDCQQWVSACLLARTNVTGLVGTEIMLWIDDPATSDPPDPDYTFEGGFFGNLFTSSSGYVCQDAVALVNSVTAARVCSVTTGCLVPLINRYIGCTSGLLARCDGEPGTPHYEDCQAGLVPSGSEFHTVNVYIDSDVLELLEDLLGL